jgi:lysozyme family protein
VKANFKPSLAAVLVHEGGYSNHPRDPGGATMKGITQRVYDAYRKNAGKDQQSVARISDAEIEAIYYQQYWMAVRADNLPAGLDYAVFDYAVNSGPRRAIEHLQEVLGVNVDGLMGNVTVAAANDADPRSTIAKLCDRRIAFLKVIRDKEGRLMWDTFGKGWSRRVSDLRAKATDMAEKAPAAPVNVPKLPEPPPPKPSAGRSIGEVMLVIVGAIVAGLMAYFGFGGH